MRAWVFVACAIGCRGPAPEPAKPAPAAPATPTSLTHPCTGELRFALIAPLYSPVEDITEAELRALWQGHGKRKLASAPATRAALAGLGDGGGELLAHDARPTVTATRWAVIPADQLSPAWKIVTVDGRHPLAKDARGPLAVAHCGPSNIDPEAVTTVAMTGVTAMARFTAALMDKQGVTYPARDVEQWLGQADFVHVSNEVSFVSTCEPSDANVQPFCSRESYIELLAALHVNIVELSGSHLIDFGRRWLTHTIEMYEARGWKFFGGGRDQLEATRPLLLEHHGNKLAFIGCNMPRSTSGTIRNGANVAFCDLKRLDWQIRDLKRRGFSPIVSIQHEEVKGHDPPDLLVRDFRHFAEVGAAVVFGSQAHVAHPWDFHAGAYLHYGAGNFIFDQPWGSTRDGAADRFYFHRGRLLAVDRLYTRIEEQGRPRPMTDAERAVFVDKLASSHAKLEPASPWRTPRATRAERTAPDSFLLGQEVVFLRVTAPDGATGPAPLVIDLHGRKPAEPAAFTVTLRKAANASKRRLVPAIKAFMASKYAIDRGHVTLR